MIDDRILCSVIVPVYNSGSYLKQCLDSIARQSLNKHRYDIIVVNDCSTDPETIELLNEIQSQDHYEGSSIQVIHHAENKWLAAARNTGVTAAKGKYVLCLDSDDFIDPQYLKRGCLILEAHPNAGWVYPAYEKFGNYAEKVFPITFDSKEFFLNNHCVHACIFRRSDWIKIKGQRAIQSEDGLKTFEDWDFLIRLMAAGRYGIPLQEISFFYRQHMSSMVTRNWKDHIVSKYLLYRYNIHAYRRLKRSEKAKLRDAIDGRVPRPLSPLPFLDRRIAATISKIVHADIHPIDFRVFLRSIFRPNKFIEDVRGLKFLPSKAAQIAGFISNPPVTSESLVDTKAKKTFLFAQTNWNLAGGEVVLLDWFKAASNIKDYKIISVAENAPVGSKARLEEAFSEYANEWYALDRMASTPYGKLLILWNLVLEERPEILFIMSNSFAYLLSPFIKKLLPNTKIMDLLHLEDGAHPGWFEISSEFQEHLDKRIVLSHHWHRTLVKKWGELREKIVVIPNTIDPTIFSSENFNKTQLRSSWNIPDDALVVGFIGRYETQKDPIVFLNIAEKLKTDSQIVFFMMGEGSMGEQITTISRGLPNVTLLPPDKSPAWFYAMCDVMVFPSKYEGLPLVGLEAICMKVPVIATDVVGFKELEPMGIHLLNPIYFEDECVKLLLKKYLNVPGITDIYLSVKHDKKQEFLENLIETNKD